VLPVTDSTILSTFVDGVIMVVACECTSRAALNRACRVVEHSGGRILGTVFNKVDGRRDGYHGYRHYQGYYSNENGNGKDHHHEGKNGNSAA
jgi:Mrp family chromosome partitioning ATPase